MMSIWWILVIIFFAGVAGGTVNALLSDNGFILPRTSETDQGRIVRPGFAGNMLIGGITAVISWGLYGPHAELKIPLNDADVITLTLSAIAGAILIGVGSSRWLTSEIDKMLLRSAASQAAASGADAQKAAEILTSSPARVFDLASKS